MKNIALIFARGGSKGLPGKNIKPLNGKPMIQYSIDAALSAPSIDKVYVSTDDDTIADVASKGGASVIPRPDELASDASPEWLSWRHAIEWIRDKGEQFDTFISLPATSPLRSVQDIEAAITNREDAGADVCIGVTPASRSPYFNMVKESSSGYLELVIAPEQNVERRQDCPEVYDVTTVVYVAKPDFIMENYGIFSGRVSYVEIPKERAVDIDDIYDFKLAELIMKEGS
ncbi:MAG: cytidylyltransferase domain-containing protein [Neptuniibacter sp.]